MKSLSRKLLTIVGVAGMLFLASCGEEEPVVVDGPSLEIASQPLVCITMVLLVTKSALQ